MWRIAVDALARVFGGIMLIQATRDRRPVLKAEIETRGVASAALPAGT